MEFCSIFSVYYAFPSRTANKSTSMRNNAFIPQNSCALVLTKISGMAFVSQSMKTKK